MISLDIQNLSLIPGRLLLEVLKGSLALVCGKSRKRVGAEAEGTEFFCCKSKHSKR
jgi:hypothetical protein